jgi:glycosyltransferase involved in cell wall biosynthesis
VIQSGTLKTAPPTISVSVVIPAYQCASYIGETLDSVLAQTFAHYEIVVVNDGSPDTDELEMSLAPYASLIRYLKQPNGGPSSARNRGIREAKGRFIAFLDSDDLWLPAHLTEQMKLLERDPKLALVYSDSVLLRGDAPIARSFELNPQGLHVTFEALVAETCTIGTSTVVASKQAILDAGGFDEERRRSEDFDLWLRMAHRGANMAYSEQTQVLHRAANGLASDDQVMKKAQIDVYEKMLLTLPITGAQAELLCNKTQQISARLQTDAAKEHLRAGRYLEALESVKNANTVLKSSKLAVLQAGLRYCPRIVRAFVVASERWRERKQQRRQQRFLRERQRLVASTPGKSNLASTVASQTLSAKQ